MFALLALLACYEEPAAVHVPAASWQEVTCEEAGQGVELPEGALVLTVMGCDLDRCVSNMLEAWAVSLDEAPVVSAWCNTGADGAVFVSVSYIEP